MSGSQGRSGLLELSPGLGQSETGLCVCFACAVECIIVPHELGWCRFMDLHSEELEELLEKGSKVPLSSMQAALCHTYCSAAGVVFEDPEAAAARRQAEAQAEEQGRVKQEGAGKKKKKKSKAKAEAKQTASGMGGEGAGSGAAKEEL